MAVDVVLDGSDTLGHLAATRYHTVKTTMRRLQAKLGEPPVIRTVREGGYQIGER
jgi:DNA-binding response OmpR family regulator